MSSQVYHLEGPNKRRRVGLSRTGYALLSVVGNSKRDQQPLDSMPVRSAHARQDNAKKGPAKQAKGNPKINSKEEEEDDVLAPPIGSSGGEDLSSDDQRDQAATIRGTILSPGNDRPKSLLPRGRGRVAEKQNSSRLAGARGTRSQVTAGVNEGGSPKRKSQEDPPTSGSGDIFGRLNLKKVKSTYGGSSQSKRPNSSQISAPKSTQEKEEPSESFNRYDLGLSPEKKKPPKSKFSIPGLDGLDSPDASPVSKQSESILRPPSNIQMLKDAIPDSDEDEYDVETSKFPDLSGLDSAPPKFSPASAERSLLANYMKPATQAPAFQNYSFDGDSTLLSQANEILNQDKRNTTISSKSIWDLPSTLDDQPFTQDQQPSPLCPMCHAPVNPSDLASAGHMTTRAQELFCRSHQRKTALVQWTERGYPNISWSSLPTRLTAYLSSIETWIKGQPISHYRTLYSSALAKGENRSLRKTTSNLIPGYYGPRGSQIISEFVMEHFSELLRKRAPIDRVISKCGVTPYVQAVVVMEVAATLIAEDMVIDIEKARTILDESVGVGELLWEEGGDATDRGRDKRKVEDSEDDEEAESEDELAL